MKTPLRIDYKHGGVDAEGTLLIPFTNRTGTQAHQGELKDMAEIIRRVNAFDGLMETLRECLMIVLREQAVCRHSGRYFGLGDDAAEKGAAALAKATEPTS